MPFRFIRHTVFVVFAVFFLSVLPARAEISIAVVDIDTILSQSKAAKSVQKQLDEKRKSFLADVKKEEDKLRADQKAIEKERADLSKEELLEKAQEFEKKRMDARKDIQTQKVKLDKAYAETMNTLTKTIYDVAQEIADEDKIDLIITRQNIIVGSMSLDITKKLMERMDKKLPKLALKVK